MKNTEELKKQIIMMVKAINNYDYLEKIYSFVKVKFDKATKKADD